MITDLIIIIYGFLFDILSKKDVFEISFKFSNTKEFIPGFISFEKAYNQGAGFSSFQNNVFVLKVLPVFICIAMITYYIISKIINKDKRIFKTSIQYLAIDFLLAGAFGNLYDRFVIKEGVRDFLRYDFIESIIRRPFAIGNVADLLIIIGTVLLFIFIIKIVIKDIKDNKKMGVKN